jgi:hypothetical protein
MPIPRAQTLGVLPEYEGWFGKAQVVSYLVDQALGARPSTWIEVEDNTRDIVQANEPTRYCWQM